MKTWQIPFSMLLIFFFGVQTTYSKTAPIPLGIALTTTPTPGSSETNSYILPELKKVIPVPLSQVSAINFGPEEYPYFINPLTGLKVEDLSLLERRPIAVKITNYPRSTRPQFGLPQADIIFEYLLERQIPRFIALYYGQNVDKVGPIRSGRLFDEHIMRMYDAFLVFGNADNRVSDYMIALEKHFVSSLVVEYEEDFPCPKGNSYYLCVDADIKSYNNLFTNIDLMEEYVTKRNGNYRANLEGMLFSLQPPPNGKLATDIRVEYSFLIFHKWIYDSFQNKYFRFQEPLDYDYASGKKMYVPHMDAATGKQLSATNIVVLTVPHSYYVKSSTTEILNISLHGSGDATIFRDGYSFPASWKRNDSSGVLALYDLAGNPFPLKPGQTWYQVISQYSATNYQGPVWEFEFRRPPWKATFDEIINVVEGDEPLEWFFSSQNPELPFPNSD